MISSMTGFCSLTESGLTCEVRSVNHRFLEVSVRMPEALRYLEPTIRQICRDKLQRGKVDWQLRVAPELNATLQVNAQALDRLKDALSQVEAAFPSAAIPSQTDLLAWPRLERQCNLCTENARRSSALGKRRTRQRSCSRSRPSTSTWNFLANIRKSKNTAVTQTRSSSNAFRNSNTRRATQIFA